MAYIDKEVGSRRLKPDPLIWTIATAAGWVGAARSETGLVALTLPQASVEECVRSLTQLGVQEGCSVVPPEPGHVLAGLAQALNRYFSGEPERLDFPVDWTVFTPFQQRVLQVVQGIRRGELLSYGQVAAQINCPRASRAVGGALGANHILLVVPCHRVIRSDGTLGGFGSGLAWKVRLLTVEGINPGPGGKYRLF
ncbi:methylated-DNA--[protein]-cysteine S-methyltransferase [Desulfoscipio gibsoniae]|uniref:methylated-DNA--[protein]-cysteine S-methyltransferase n=1 Tax=Desulfoscipio gibsoniae DSM 7213 TaxID=767817 RepID=R4KC13_9FIRM|nr:methylated-DNA--[protein]-cysteine S-methyltransferase [Desulfoscipio gibsoniae]AGL00738.1 O-6-methylguanine DNA methyltransferase [Desulfoscipio gibsoniae DSM 7213]